MSRRLLRSLVVAAALAWAALWPWAAGAAVMELVRGEVTFGERDVSPPRQVQLPFHLDRELGTRPGFASFEVRFALPELPAEPYAVYFARIGNTAEVRINGTLLARLGDIGRPNHDDFSKGPQYLRIPARLLERDNVFRIDVRADGGRRAGLSGLMVGPAEEVRALYTSAWRWRMLASLVVSVLSVLVGLTALVLWATQTDSGPLARRRDPIYLAAAVAELCWALRVGDIAMEHPPLPWPLWGVVLTAAFAGWICCIALFCHHVAGWHRHPGMKWFKAWLALLFGASIVCSALAYKLHQPLFLTAWLGCANLFFIGYALLYLARAVRVPDTARLLVALAGAFNVAVGVRDWVTIRISGSYDESTWIRYSSVLFGLVLGYIVVTRFRAASAQARDLMANLTARVAEKEAQLQGSYARLELLAREQERASERSRILRDMHDGVGAHISSAIRQLQSGRSSNEQVLETLRDSLDQLKLSIDSMGLPPGDVTALLASLRYRLEPRLSASDIELRWEVEELPPVRALDAAGVRHLQFMVFEVLSNVLQHSRARSLWIEARADGPAALVRIRDDGRGFDTAAPGRKGLLSLRERAAAIGARLTIDSGPQGTTVEIRLE